MTFSSPSLAGSTCPTIGLHTVAGLLGVNGETRKVIRALDAMVAGCGFPPPLPSRVHRGSLIFRAELAASGAPPITTAAITVRSRWLTSAVRAWLDDFLPPAARAAQETGARQSAANEMDAAARAISAHPRLRVVAGKQR